MKVDLRERLAAHDLADQLGHVVVLHHVLGVLLRVGARLLRAPQDVLGELGLLDADLLLLGNLVEQELRRERVALRLECGIDGEQTPPRAQQATRAKLASAWPAS